MATDEDIARGRVVALTLTADLAQWVESVAAVDGLSLSATCRRFIVHAKNASTGTAESPRAQSIST